MMRAVAIMWREYASFFRIPLGWIVLSLFLVVAGVVFGFSAVRPGQPATMRSFFELMWWLLALLAPATSMRLFSEEMRTGTIEPLLTSPVSEFAVVVGKYAATVLFLLTLLAPTLLYVLVLELLSRPDYGPIAAGYLGVVLLGMLYLAVGCLASSLTASQPLAFLGTLFALFLIEVLASFVAPIAPDLIRRLLFALSPSQRLGDFARGLIDTSHIVFFLASSAWLLVLTTVMLQSRRWR